MKRRQFIVGFPLLACSTALAQDEDKVDGVYELRVAQKADAIKFVMMRKIGGELVVRDLATGQDFKGRMTGNKIVFSMILGPINVPPNPMMMTPHTFVGAVTQAGLAGQVQAGDFKQEWTASRLTTVWVCSNHRPRAHVAKSKDEMKTNTEKNKCEGWRRARPENIG